MADDPSLDFGEFPQPFCSQQVVSFQPSVTTSGSGGMPVYLDCSSGMDSNTVMLSTTPSVVVSTTSSNTVADPGQNLKYGGPLAADWSRLELDVLKDGLQKYGNEQGIMKYIKIAASLPSKTVRDVAMKCQWLGKRENSRRRKSEDHHTGRKMKERKPQNNIELFHRTRRNINGLLQTMNQMPGIMSKMPPLPVSVNENLASFVLPGLTVPQFLGGSQLKEEPRGW
uniref:Myb-like domain-containing protein n=1 Tax=Oryza glaberrima TaxID=4538 RepID=I1PN50_ORYGL